MGGQINDRERGKLVDGRKGVVGGGGVDEMIRVIMMR